MSPKLRVVIAFSPVFLSACVSTVGNVVTAPFKVAGKAADWATTSQSESDRNRGRALRKAEDRARKACRQEPGGDLARDQCVRDRMRSNAMM